MDEQRAKLMSKSAHILREQGYGLHANVILDALSTLQSKPEQVAVPEGWKLVPIKPTQEQHKAIIDCLNEVPDCQSSYGLYSAGIAAAPQPPEQQWKEVSCTHCDGSGSVEVYESVDPATRSATVDCQKCKGNGYTIEQAAQQPTAPGGEVVETQWRRVNKVSGWASRWYFLDADDDIENVRKNFTSSEWEIETRDLVAIPSPVKERG